MPMAMRVRVQSIIVGVILVIALLIIVIEIDNRSRYRKKDAHTDIVKNDTGDEDGIEPEKCQYCGKLIVDRNSGVDIPLINEEDDSSDHTVDE